MGGRSGAIVSPESRSNCNRALVLDLATVIHAVEMNLDSL
jgi:hypothetical protein